jgi:hypothetical protein
MGQALLGPLHPQKTSDNFLLAPTAQELFISLERRQGISK